MIPADDIGHLVYGYENPKDIRIVNAMVRAIIEKDIIPPIALTRITDKRYQGCYLIDWFPDIAGHHTAIAHMIAKKDLQGIVTGNTASIDSKIWLLKEIVLDSTSAYEARRKNPIHRWS